MHIVLDDFGAGYSRLNYLSRLPVDVLKIDRGLIGDVMDSMKQRTPLKVIVDMARINNMHIVAGGVETVDVQELVGTMGVDYIQDFFHVKPIPEDERVALLSVFNKK